MGHSATQGPLTTHSSPLPPHEVAHAICTCGRNSCPGPLHPWTLPWDPLPPFSREPALPGPGDSVTDDTTCCCEVTQRQQEMQARTWGFGSLTSPRRGAISWPLPAPQNPPLEKGAENNARPGAARRGEPLRGLPRGALCSRPRFPGAGRASPTAPPTHVAMRSAVLGGSGAANSANRKGKGIPGPNRHRTRGLEEGAPGRSWGLPPGASRCTRRGPPGPGRTWLAGTTQGSSGCLHFNHPGVPTAQ